MKKVRAAGRFLSCEPLLEELQFPEFPFEWVIVGAQTKTSKVNAFQPRWDWVDKLVRDAEAAKAKVYLKSNLRTEKPC
jgi:protein gp37